MSDGYPLRPLGEVMHLDIQRTPMKPATTYRLAGVRNAGQGLVAKGELDGGDTEYAAMNVLHVGQVVMRKLTAWEGPITVVPAEFDGFVVSNEFPTFTLGPELMPDWMRHVCRSPRLSTEMKNRVSGTVQRRKRLNPEQLLQIQLPIPLREVQARIVEMLDAVDDQITELDTEADAILVSCAGNRELYKQRNTVERCINRLKQRRGVATRYEKTATVYLAGLHLAGIFLWSARWSERNGLASPAPQRPDAGV
jgi:type I restriction enzyme S subunit